MKSIPIAIKIVINIIFFVIYSFIGIIFGDFMYGLIQTLLNKPVAGIYDPIHNKIALVSILIVLLVSGLFRKYFYISVQEKAETKTKQKSNKKTYTQKIKEKKIENNEEKENQEEPKMKIYIDKEIK